MPSVVDARPRAVMRFAPRWAPYALLIMWTFGAESLASPATPAVQVFAAASATEVLGVLAERYRQRVGVSVRLTLAASSTLATQIDNGAPADVFLSADEEWMDFLATRGRLQQDSRRDVAGNRLVLVASAGGGHCRSLDLSKGRLPLRSLLGDGRLALADPDGVPAGRYARSALVQAGLWDDVVARLARAENVRAALQYVARGEAPLGIVYATDARVDAGVCVIGTFPDGSYPRIRYPAALIGRTSAAARGFLDYLSSSEAAAVWASFGFASP